MSTILTENFYKQHCAPLASKSGLVSVIMLLITFMLPMFLIIRTHNFWVGTRGYFEQPSVSHTNEIVVFVYTDDRVYTVASTQSLNDLLDSSSESGASLSPTFKVSIIGHIC